MGFIAGKIEDPQKKNVYVILGCGGIGLAVANELERRGKELILVDKNEARVKTLLEQGFEAISMDISDPALLEELPFDRLETVFILSSDIPANRKALENIRNVNTDIQVVSRALESHEKTEMEAAGADLVVMPSLLPPNAIASAVVQYTERLVSMKCARKLLKIIESIKDGKLGIVVHDNPDPDAIASAMALKEIAASVNVQAEILYKGRIEHQENQAFVNLLDIDLNSKAKDPSEFKKIALIEGSSPGVNNLLPPDAKVSIIIDHHQPLAGVAKAEYIDIRTDVGATSTIMTKYLQELEIPLKTELATALLYGIRVDTQDFRRKTSPEDFMAAAFLVPLVNHEIIHKIETPPMSTETLDILGEAIRNRKIKGSYLASNVGTIINRDALAQAADFLLNLEGITTTLVFGLGEDRIFISGRTRDVRINMGKVLQEAFGAEYAGGHTSLGGAQIPLGLFSDSRDRETLLKLAEEVVTKKFFNAVGIENGMT